MRFADRGDAGRRLARRLGYLRGSDVVVVGLPRGGVLVASEVAAELRAPLDVIVVRKLGVPSEPELGFGAVGEEGVRVIDKRIVQLAGLTEAKIAAVEARERAQVDRRVRRLRSGRPPVPFAGRAVLVIDDGIATGSTARAACMVARARGASRVILAVPVASQESVLSLRRIADEVICLHTPPDFFGIGEWYDDFSQATDEEVAALLGKAAPDPAEVTVESGGVRLPGSLVIPGQAPGLVVFAHGSGSGRASPRNRFVAAELNRAGLATLLIDLLTPREELDRANVFDIGLLAARVAEIADWLRAQPATSFIPVGYFGASTGAAAALRAAAAPGAQVRAIVSRGGRPDLARPWLASVRAPVLLIVGGADKVVLDLNQQARSELTCENQLVVIPGATHLFEEPGALAQVAELAADWFTSHLRATVSGTRKLLAGNFEYCLPGHLTRASRPRPASARPAGS